MEVENSGDGFAIARHLINKGAETNVYLVCGSDFHGDAEINYNIITDGEAVKCGYKIDNTDVYVKRINFGNLPNSTLKDVNHNITNFSKIVKIEGTALTNTGYGYSIPNNNMIVFYTNEYVRITTTTNESDYNAEINIYYLGE